jgi:hypothetical protein
MDCHGPQMANDKPLLAWMLTNSVCPSGLNVAPANSSLKRLAPVLDLLDNITVSRRGTLVLCEDNVNDNFVRALTPSGRLSDIALNRLIYPPGSCPSGSATVVADPWDRMPGGVSPR